MCQVRRVVLLFFTALCFLALTLSLFGCQRRSPSRPQSWVAVRRKVIDLSILSVPVYNSVSMVADGRGRLYIAAPDLHQVVVIDTLGNVVETIGQWGEGPGELMKPTAVELIGDSLLAVSDFTGFRISLFTLDGRFVRSVPVRMGPWLAWSGRYLCANSARPEYLVDLYGVDLEYMGGVGDGDLASIDQRLGPGLLIEAAADTVWILHWRRRPILLTEWVVAQGRVGQWNVGTPEMTRNILFKDRALERESRELMSKGVVAAPGFWQHIGSVVRDRRGLLWLNYYWRDPKGAQRSVFYVYTSGMHLVAKVTGFDDMLDSPCFDPSGRLWALEWVSSSERAGNKLVVSCYEIGRRVNSTGERARPG